MIECLKYYFQLACYRHRNEFYVRALYYAEEARRNMLPTKGIVDELAAIEAEAAFAFH